MRSAKGSAAAGGALRLLLAHAAGCAADGAVGAPSAAPVCGRGSGSNVLAPPSVAALGAAGLPSRGESKSWRSGQQPSARGGSGWAPRRRRCERRPAASAALLSARVPCKQRLAARWRVSVHWRAGKTAASLAGPARKRASSGRPHTCARSASTALTRIARTRSAAAAARSSAQVLIASTSAHSTAAPPTSQTAASTRRRRRVPGGCAEQASPSRVMSLQGGTGRHERSALHGQGLLWSCSAADARRSSTPAHGAPQPLGACVAHQHRAVGQALQAAGAAAEACVWAGPVGKPLAALAAARQHGYRASGDVDQTETKVAGIGDHQPLAGPGQQAEVGGRVQPGLVDGAILAAWRVLASGHNVPASRG